MGGAGGAGGVGGAKGGGGHGHGHGAHAAGAAHGPGAAHGGKGGKKPASIDHANKCVNGQHGPGSPGQTPFPNTPSANGFLKSTSSGQISSSHWSLSASGGGGSSDQSPTIIAIMANGQMFGYVFGKDETWQWKGEDASKTAAAGQAPKVGVQHQHGSHKSHEHGHSKSAHGHQSGHSHGAHGVQHAHSGHGHHGGHMKAGGKGGGHGGGGHK